MRLVIVESPYTAPTPDGIDTHVRYARAAIADCLARSEAPLASHLLYTQPGVLRDEVPAERTRGIDAGLAWARAAAATVVYADLYLSRGMRYGIEHAVAHGRPIEVRVLSMDALEAAIGVRSIPLWRPSADVVAEIVRFVEECEARR